MKFVEVKTAKEFASTFFGDPVLKMAVNAALDNATEADVVEVIHGQWIIEEDGDFCNVKCSACGKDYACHYGMLQLQNFDYCPNCGAKNGLRKEN